MPYDNVISRSDASALIPEDVAALITRNVTEQSAAMRLFRRVTLSRAQQRVPVLQALPTAYFVNGDTGLKQTTEVAWGNKFLNVEELAAIVPIPEAVIDDTDFDVWGEIRPLLEEAVGRAVDAAVFFGVNAPGSWPTNLNAAADAAGNDVLEGSAAAAGGWLNDLDQAIAALEDDGYDPTGYVMDRSARGKMRQARDTTGQSINNRVGQGFADYDGDPIVFAMRGLWPKGGAAGTNVRAFALQADQFVFGVRQDMTYKLLDQAVIQDNTGAIIYNLAQQDMVALRVTFRCAWQVANIINYDRPTEAERYPAAVLRY